MRENQSLFSSVRFTELGVINLIAAFVLSNEREKSNRVVGVDAFPRRRINTRSLNAFAARRKPPQVLNGHSAKMGTP